MSARKKLPCWLHGLLLGHPQKHTDTAHAFNLLTAHTTIGCCLMVLLLLLLLSV